MSAVVVFYHHVLPSGLTIPTTEPFTPTNLSQYQCVKLLWHTQKWCAHHCLVQNVTPLFPVLEPMTKPCLVRYGTLQVPPFHYRRFQPIKTHPRSTAPCFPNSMDPILDAKPNNDLVQ